MSEEKSQDGTTVKGYHTLSQGEIQQMNQLKEASGNFLRVLNETLKTGADKRWAWIAESNMQMACMAACRAVAKPDDDC